MTSIPRQHRRRCRQGFTYIEMMLSVTIMAMVMLALMGLVNTATETSDSVRSSNDLTQQARFAMARMVKMTGTTPRLLLPLVDNPATNWPENLREQTIPASTPIGDSSFASAVLAVNLPFDIDLDGNKVPDADDDGDGLFNEDLPNDNHHDFAPGIVLIDDDGDGNVDGGGSHDDDEDGSDNEDPIDGIDNDGDGSIDEDASTDSNGDGCPGICGVDDDASGQIDLGSAGDDDEEGGEFEDPYDPVVYYLNGATLIERMPVPWDTDGNSFPDGPVDGRDYVESAIAENVSRFRVERIDQGNGVILVDLVLELTDAASGESISLQTQVRPGGAL